MFYYHGYGENDVKEQFLKAKIFDGKSFWEAEKNWHGMMNHKYKKMIFVNCGLKKPYHVQKAKKYFFGVWRNENGVVVMRFLTHSTPSLSVHCLIIIIAKKKTLSRTSPCFLILSQVFGGITFIV